MKPNEIEEIYTEVIRHNGFIDMSLKETIRLSIQKALSKSQERIQELEEALKLGFKNFSNMTERVVKLKSQLNEKEKEIERLSNETKMPSLQ